LFFGNAGNPGPHGSGTERYELELARAIAAEDSTNEFHYIYLYPGGPAAACVDRPNVIPHVLAPRVRPICLGASLPALHAWLRPAVLHACFIPPLVAPGPLVYTLPCHSPFVYPGLYDPKIGARLRFLFRRGIQTARAIICYSAVLQDWAHTETGLPLDRLPVIPMAASSLFRPFEPEPLRAYLREKYGLVHPYFYFSGRWEQRKNLPRLVEAFARFKAERRSDLKLVLSGSRFWAAAEVDEVIARHGISSDVIELGRTPFDDLPQLYAGARALVFPSVCETFGLPVVEAMCCGTAVLTSTTSCLPEVAGGAALLVDPLSVDEIAHGMFRLASDDALVESLRAKGLARGAAFTWKRTAQLTLETYRRFGRANGS